MRGRTRLALGRCHVRQAADGSGVGQLLEYEVRFSQVLARRQRRQRRRQRRLRWRRERRLPSGSARPRDITGDQKIECWLNVLGLGIPREMRDLSCSKPKNFPACRRLSEVRGRAVHAVREGAPQPPWVPLTADPAQNVRCAFDVGPGKAVTTTTCQQHVHSYMLWLHDGMEAGFGSHKL